MRGLGNRKRNLTIVFFYFDPHQSKRLKRQAAKPPVVLESID